MKTLNFTNEEFRKLKKLIKELESYYKDYEKPWSFEDVDDQRQIACEMLEIVKPKIKEHGKIILKYK